MEDSVSEPAAGLDAEDREARLRRMRMRCWRRGVKEMDLILGGYFDAEGTRLEDEALDRLDALLGEDDPALYAWVAGRDTPPESHAAMISAIRAHHGLA